MNLLSSVWCLLSACVKLALCEVYLVLNVLAVSPMYVFSVSWVFTFASYTILRAVHLPGIGQSSFLLQLQESIV